MNEIKQFIISEIFQNPKAQDELKEKVLSLVDAFKGNKSILLILHDYINNSAAIAHTPKQREDINKVLTREWLEAWLENPIVNEEAHLLAHYFPKYTDKEQRVLIDKIKVDLPSMAEQLQIKPMQALDEALFEYKRGSIDFLNKYVFNSVTLSEKDIQQITKVICETSINGILPLVVDLLNKSPKHCRDWIRIGLDQSFNILMEPREDIDAYAETLESHYRAMYKYVEPTSVKSIDMIVNESVIGHFAYLTPSIYLNSMVYRFTDKLRELDPPSIIYVLESADKLIKKYPCHTDDDRKEYNIRGEGIEIILNILDDATKEMNNHEYIKFSNYISKLYKSHKEQELLSMQLKNYNDTSKTKVPKI